MPRINILCEKVPIAGFDIPKRPENDKEMSAMFRELADFLDSPVVSDQEFDHGREVKHVILSEK